MNKISQFMLDEKRTKFTVSLIAVFFGVISGLILMLIVGQNPLDMIFAFIKSMFGLDLWRMSFNSKHIFDVFATATPLILTGLAVAFAFRTGLFNIGTEGQVIMGSLGAVIIGVSLDLPLIIHLPLAVVTAGVFGALYAFIPGFLKAFFNVNEVVSTIMLNYVALYLANYVIKTLPKSTSQGTVQIAESASLRADWLKDLTGGSTLHLGLFIAIIAIIAFWIIINKTVLGYELKAVGYNKNAAKYAGIKTKKNIVIAMMISGVFAGLAGACLTLGDTQRMNVTSSFSNYGFDGIAVALVGVNVAIGIGLSAILFGVLKNSQLTMQIKGVPGEIAGIVTAFIVFFVALQYAIKKILLKINKDKEKDKILTEDNTNNNIIEKSGDVL